MITRHYGSLPSSANWHVVVDDFGNELHQYGLPFGTHRMMAAWAAAYRFANGQSFEQAGMRSIGALVEEH
jgi:hypothetical protein